MKNAEINNDEIEIIDIFDEDNQKKVNNRSLPSYDEEELQHNTNKPAKKKRKLKKKLLFQVIFCSVSIIFILGCCIFYGSRLVKYYKIYNPKDSSGKVIKLFADSLMQKTSLVYDGEGLYRNNGSYIYKGTNVNNYIKFSNLTWRIMKINTDKSIDIILDDSINNLMWNNKTDDYIKSDVNSYLNEYVLPILNSDALSNTLICSDIIDDLGKVKCDKRDTSNKIRLASIDEFLNSSVNSNSYISNGNDIWLSNRGSEKVWVINNNNLSYAESTNLYDIKPVVTLKNSTIMLGGTGTSDDPYIIEKNNNKVQVGKHIKLGDDIRTIYSMDENSIKLTLSSLYKNGSTTYRFDLKSNKYNPNNKSSLAAYLNNEFYNSLLYKDLIIDTEWYTGEYSDSYKSIKSEKVVAKVGIPSITDLKLDKGVNNYYVLNGSSDGKSYLYNDYLISSKPTLSRGIKPAISIKNLKVKSGIGTLEDPFILEEK